MRVAQLYTGWSQVRALRSSRCHSVMFGSVPRRLRRAVGTDMLWITVAMVGARSLADGVEPPDRRGHRTRPNPRRRRVSCRPARHPRQAVDALCAASWPLYLGLSGRPRSNRAMAFARGPVVALVVLPVPEASHLALPSLAGTVRGLATSVWAATKGRPAVQDWALGGAVAAWGRRVRPLLRVFDVDVDRAQG